MLFPTHYTSVFLDPLAFYDYSGFFSRHGIFFIRRAVKKRSIYLRNLQPHIRFFLREAFVPLVVKWFALTGDSRR